MSEADDQIDRDAGSLERLISGDCERQGHKWVSERGKRGPVCIRCGFRPLEHLEAKKA